MRPPDQLDELRFPSPGLGALPRDHALLHNLPEVQHVLIWDDLVTQTAEHEYRDIARDERHLRRRVPLLVAHERERAEHGKCTRDEAREREEGVFEDDSANLRRLSGLEECHVGRSTYGAGVAASKIDGHCAA